MSETPARPALFIASSREGLTVAYAVQDNLQHDALCTAWPQGSFWPGDRNLDSLVRQVGTTDFGVFVFTPDDVATIRKSTTAVARDNVVFELGLFIGALGADRCFIVRPRGEDLHFPTDLIGVSPLDYEPDRPDKNVQAALGPACNAVRQAMGRFGKSASRERSVERPALGFDEVDIIAILEAWLGSTMAGRPIYMDVVEQELRLPAGSCAKYIERAAIRWGWQAKYRGARTITFEQAGPGHIAYRP